MQKVARVFIEVSDEDIKKYENWGYIRSDIEADIESEVVAGINRMNPSPAKFPGWVKKAEFIEWEEKEEKLGNSHI